MASMLRAAKILIFYGCRATGLFALSRRITRNSLKILCYHGFEMAGESKFRSKLFMSAGLFEQRMATLKRLGYNVVPLSNAVRNLYSAAGVENSVVITIDDGFYSFHRLALPVLKKYNFASTVYVTTYYVEHESPIFRLVVQYMFWKSSIKKVVLVIPGLNQIELDMMDEKSQYDATWSIINYGEKLTSESARRSICTALGESLDISFTEIENSHMMELMRPWQIQELSSTGVSVQLHTHRHRFPDDDDESASRELGDNIRVLNQLAAGDKVHFCYPSGVWSPEHWKILSDFGIESATTCHSGINTRQTPKYALSRFLDGEDVHPLEFEAGLSGFRDLLKAMVDRLLNRSA